MEDEGSDDIEDTEEESDSDDDEEDDSDDSDDEKKDDDDDSDDWEAVEEGEETPQESKPEGPAEWQRFLMRNYENAFPIMYTIGALFVGLWLVNAMGILVSGVGGPIAFNGDAPHTESTVDADGFFSTSVIQPGEIYDCRDDVQVGGCKNSLTPFAGENGASSMPAGFYWDGILFMILGLAGLGGIGYLQMQIKAMRAEHRRKKSGDESENDEVDSTEEKDSDEDDGDDSDDDDDGDSDEDEEDDDSDDEEDDDSDDEEEDDSDDEEDDDDDSDEENDEDSEDGGEDGIEIGSRVGVEDEDGDWYGEVVEFDDDADTVIVKREDDGDEYEVEWDSLFQDD